MHEAEPATTAGPDMLLTTNDSCQPSWLHSNLDWHRDAAAGAWLLPVSSSSMPQDPTPSGGPAGGSGPAPAGGNPKANVPNQDNAGGGGQGAGGVDTTLFLVMGAVVLFMIISSFRRESKARKQQQEMLASIKQGDRVVTSSGIHATVHKLDDRTVTLLLDSMQVTFERSAVARIVRDQVEEPKKTA